MPTPLLTYELYDTFLSISDMKDKDERLQNYSVLLLRLSSQNRYCLGLLLELLYKISLNSSNNMMTPNNLGICFGPNILRTQDPNPLIFARDNGKILTCCQHLIENYPDLKEIFNDELVQTERSILQEKLNSTSRLRTQSSVSNLNMDPIQDRMRSQTSPAPVTFIDKSKTMKKVVEVDEKLDFQLNPRISLASMIVEDYCEPPDDPRRSLQPMQKSPLKKRDLPPVPQKMSMKEKMKLVEELENEEEEKLMTKQISDSMLYLPDIEPETEVTLILKDENKKKEVYFYLTNIFCTKEKPFEGITK
jgi:hypothetical protein